jgi:hypothetical protein
MELRIWSGILLLLQLWYAVESREIQLVTEPRPGEEYVNIQASQRKTFLNFLNDTILIICVLRSQESY